MSRQSKRVPWGRWVLGVLLLAVIFWVGTQSETLFGVFTRWWQELAGALGLGALLEHVQRGTSSGVTRRSLPAMLTYGVLYIGLCLLLLRVLAHDVRHWWQAVACYGLAAGLCVLLLLAARLAGNSPVLYRVARQFIDLLTSPLPILLLLPLLLPSIRRAFTRAA